MTTDSAQQALELASPELTNHNSARARVTELIDMGEEESDFPPAPEHSTAPLATAFTPGTRIAHYEIIRELGRGGMGTVYLARDTKLARKVAIKFLHSHNLSHVERFLSEARATAQCQHENIVIIHEVSEDSDVPFMVLEHLEGQSLRAVLTELAGPPLSPGRVIELILPVVAALVCAHERGIVHRDLKPDNIFVTDSGVIKVLDFGIAKDISRSVAHFAERAGQSTTPASIGPRDASPPTQSSQAAIANAVRPPSPAENAPPAPAWDTVSPLTSANALIGTFPYMSPEQWRGQEIDASSDIWAVGIILFEMLAGHHPLNTMRGTEFAAVAELEQPMPSLGQAAPTIAPALIDIVDRCLRKTKTARFASAEELLTALESQLPGHRGRRLTDDDCPYPGLTSFQELDADRFFGRMRDVSAVMARMGAQPLIGITGPSGIGKSSFVRAGVIPALKRSDDTWETHIIRPGKRPLEALASLLVPMLTESTASVIDQASDHRRLVQRLGEEPGYLGTLLRARAQRHQTKILLVVDQFEELYTLVQDFATRLAFTTCLTGVADDVTTPLRIIVSIRSDFLDRTAEDRDFMIGLTAGLMILPPPDRAILREALLQPATLVGYRFESQQLIETMLDALETTHGALPLLQFAGTKLWESRDRERRLLTGESYQNIGGIDGALASHADAVLDSLPAASQKLARTVFQHLVTPERTRAIATISDLRTLAADANAVDGLIDQLTQARLLLTHSGEGNEGAVVEIVHESLINSWPLLRRWLDEHADDGAFLAELATVAKRWHHKGRPQGLLWRGEALDEARRWYRRFRGPLPSLHRDYLQSAIALADRTTRLKRMFIAGIMSVLVVLIAVGSIALLRIRAAEQHAQRQAEMADQAKLRVIEQLDILRVKEREKRAAEQQVEHSKVELEQANERLRLALEVARTARKTAEGESQRAQKALLDAESARNRAQDESARAQLATEAERRARTELERLLELERQRTARLERRFGNLDDELR